MSKETIITYGVSGIAAAIPIGIWLYILFKKNTQDRKYLFLSFLGGVLAVTALMLLKAFWAKNPQYDIFSYLNKKVNDPKAFYAATYITVGILEEIVKQFLLRYLDTRKAVIRSIGDSVKFSLVAALGFAFAENIFYLQETYASYSGFSGVLIITYVFRSTFTAAGHMCFSGLFGYFYGLARFSANIGQEAKLEGKKFYFTRFISRLFNLAETGILRRKYIIEGLLTAILLHGTFNFILSLEQMYDVSAQLPSILAMLLIALSYTYLQFLRKRDTAQLQLLVDVSKQQKSTISTKNEEVVLELISQWIKEKKYADAITVANRLLEKDPDNTSAQFLKAKANDALHGQDAAYSQLIMSLKENPGTVKDDRSIMDKLKKQQEENKNTKVEIDTSHDNDVYHIE